ncbi:MAG: trmD [Gammaproteobacteria bacterium]|nr:trmD [Gammaproteobacteria bacterium]
MLRIGVVSLFPEMFAAVTAYGITGRAVTRGILEVKIFNPRDYTHDVHHTVDDRPYGGGPGMVMLYEPVVAALRQARQQLPGARVINLTPQGRRLAQEDIRSLSARDSVILLAGRYEGIDERVIMTDVDEEYSIGDYVLSGGELPAMVIIDAVSRNLPGVLGHDDSAAQDSFFNGLLDAPHFTRPEEAGGVKVPEILLSGDHARIRRWRLKQALGRTWLRRPDLLNRLQLDAEQRSLLDEFIREQN